MDLTSGDLERSLTIFAIEKIGAIPVPTSPLWSAEEVAFVANDSEPPSMAGCHPRRPQQPKCCGLGGGIPQCTPGLSVAPCGEASAGRRWGLSGCPRGVRLERRGSSRTVWEGDCAEVGWRGWPCWPCELNRQFHQPGSPCSPGHPGRPPSRDGDHVRPTNPVPPVRIVGHWVAKLGVISLTPRPGLEAELAESLIFVILA